MTDALSAVAQAGKVALVHDWLTGMRGGERCLEALCDLFPEADLFTLLHVKGSVSELIERRRIHTSPIQALPFAASRYRYYLPLFPWAVERLSLDGYELILSGSHCVAKGVKVPPGALHIAYVYTPMRYIWDLHHAYVDPGRMGPLSRTLLRIVAGHLRRWDLMVNDRVHYFAAISRHVADRIRHHYGRDAEVIHPPVETARFHIADRPDDYYLVAGAFAPYKRIDLAIEAFNRLRRRLVIVGEGQEGRRLRRIAGPTIEFLGWRPDDEFAGLLARCRALVFPGEEDFGILPVEAMACGRPVIAFGKGGIMETVIPLNMCEWGVRSCGVQRIACSFRHLAPRTSQSHGRFFPRADRRGLDRGDRAARAVIRQVRPGGASGPCAHLRSLDLRETDGCVRRRTL